jgi:integrase
VIAGDNPTQPRADLHRPWRIVSHRAGLNGLRIHDLRHGFASVGAGSGLGLPIIGKLLGHRSTDTTQRYAHLDADPLRRASNTIGVTIAAALDGRPSGDVVRLKGAR